MINCAKEWINGKENKVIKKTFTGLWKKDMNEPMYEWVK